MGYFARVSVYHKLRPMPGFFIFNGELEIDSEPVIGPANRSFRYGDGLFETIRVRDGKIPLAAYHFERLFSGLAALQFDIPAFFSPQLLEEEIFRLCRKNKTEKAASVRLNVFRGNGGVADPENHRPNYIIQSGVLPENYQRLNENGWILDIYPDARKSCDPLSNIKSNNYLVYLMACMYAQKNQWNDCIVLNSRERVADSVIANVFVLKNGLISTPPLTEGCIAGVMRRYLLEKMPAMGFSVQEKIIEPGEMEEADEVFLSNAVNGLRWAKQFRNKTFTNRVCPEVYQQIVLPLFS